MSQILQTFYFTSISSPSSLGWNLGHTLSEEEITDFCMDLPRYKRPHKFIFAEVPRNPTGKIEKPKLRKIYCGDSLVAQQIGD